MCLKIEETREPWTPPAPRLKFCQNALLTFRSYVHLSGLALKPSDLDTFTAICAKEALISRIELHLGLIMLLATRPHLHTAVLKFGVRLSADGSNL